jgi:hypothetical protein
MYLEAMERPTETDEWVKRAKSWRVNHFSLTDTKGDVPALLRKVARLIRQLGDVEVMDLTYQLEPSYPFNTCTITVYWYAKKPGSRSGAGTKGKRSGES